MYCVSNCQSHTLASGEAINDCTIQLVTRLSLSNLLVLALDCNFYDKMSIRNMKLN